MSDKKLIAAIEDHMQTLFETGHTFWHCAETDKTHGVPFWYFQRNRNVNMSTCSTCSKLIELKRQLYRIDKKRFPLRTNVKSEVPANFSAQCKGGNQAYNVNLHYAKSR